ncbi:MAG: beta galactosidase jelly roll domain-containing protein, partial [Flammeovirgaceae bacterium]
RNEIPNQFILAGVWEMKMERWRTRRTRQFANWNQIMVPQRWDYHGIKNYNHVAWYRKYFNLPKNFQKHNLSLILGKIDDFDEVFINGVKIGSTNDYKPFGASNSWQQTRVYQIPPSCLKSYETNVIMVKVTDIGIDGGIYKGPIMIIPSEYTAAALRNF